MCQCNLHIVPDIRALFDKTKRAMVYRMYLTLSVRRHTDTPFDFRRSSAMKASALGTGGNQMLHTCASPGLAMLSLSSSCTSSMSHPAVSRSTRTPSSFTPVCAPCSGRLLHALHMNNLQTTTADMYIVYVRQKHAILQHDNPLVASARAGTRAPEGLPSNAPPQTRVLSGARHTARLRTTA